MLLLVRMKVNETHLSQSFCLKVFFYNLFIRLSNVDAVSII